MPKSNSKASSVFLFLNFGLFGYLFWHFARQMLVVRSDGWYVGQVNLYGDLVLHLSFINKFLASGKILVDSPIFPNGKPNYPIFPDYLTALIAKFTSIPFSLFATTFIMGIVSIFVARLFIKNFIKNEKIIFLSFLLFFLNGGFGFYYFFKDFLTSSQPFLTFLANMPREYTDLKNLGYWWINSYLAYFLPQRGFLFAFPLTLLILSLLYKAFKTANKYSLTLAGFLAGTLPLVQSHSLLLILMIAVIFLLKSTFNSHDRKLQTYLISFIIISLIVSYPLFHITSSLTNPLKFIKFTPGWTSDENIFWFWFKNLGVFAPILIISLFWLYKKNRNLFFLYLPSLFIFFISNIFVFQPWNFDNSKFLIYWYFFSTTIVAYFLYDQFFQESLPKKIAGTLMVLVMIFSGVLDIFRTFTPVTFYKIFDNQDLEIAQQVKTLTPQNSIFVTSSNHNHPIPALTGRSTFLGFKGWLWSHGIDYTKRESDVKNIYLGGSQAESIIKKNRLNYVVIGPREKREFSINESYFEKFKKLPVLNWSIYDVSSLWSYSSRQN